MDRYATEGLAHKLLSDARASMPPGNPELQIAAAQVAALIAIAEQLSYIADNLKSQRSTS
ncbi:hypothetical protein AB0H57_32460 [Micromonospora sp. NPDC050686]|uniref:hypothetical protein n=1 Tax=Micromonospora sp. NPDC050686 TaxID=3154631 RepID=UPI0033D1D9B7